ncbi:MAG: hypothetical protein ACTSSJ_02090 [Candidatus Odinarchaeia archaeon]
MNIKRGILYGLITLVSSLSPLFGNQIAQLYHITLPNFSTEIIVGVAVAMGLLSGIENATLKSNPAGSGVAGLFKHFIYIAWVLLSFHMFSDITVQTDLGPVHVTLDYMLVETLILAMLVVKLIMYIWQIAFHEEIAEKKVEGKVVEEVK